MMKPDWVVVIDQAELATRLCEAAMGIERPPGMDGKQALDAMDQEPRDGWVRASRAAIDYFVDLFNEGDRVQ